MSKVMFRLKPDYRIGNYILKERLGSGCTAEAYRALEVPTGAERVVKIYGMYDENQHTINLQDFAHFCWFTEKLSHLEILPRYYHMGHVFLRPEDGIGNFYMVQEYLQGKRFRKLKRQDPMLKAFKEKVEKVHELGYGLGDWKAENLLLTDGGIRMVDCNYGRHDKPNTGKKVDKVALRQILDGQLL